MSRTEREIFKKLQYFVAIRHTMKAPPPRNPEKETVNALAVANDRGEAIFKKSEDAVTICHIQNYLTKTGRKIRKLFAGMNSKRIKYIKKSNCHVTESHIVKKPEKETVNTLAAVGAREEIILKN